MNLDKLEALARAAMPGPWHATWVSQDQRWRVENRQQLIGDIGPWYDGVSDQRDEGNAQHIAACSPEVVLALLRVVRAAKEADRLPDDLGWRSLLHIALADLDVEPPA